MFLIESLLWLENSVKPFVSIAGDWTQAFGHAKQAPLPLNYISSMRLLFNLNKQKAMAMN